jgi:hypothetical protein
MAAAYSTPPPYEPLGDRQIRLVTIDASNPASSSISCEMTVHDMSRAPPYKGLSYVWGDAKVTSAIALNGVTVEHTSNLIAALHRLRQLGGGTTTHYWIDAICINQQDNDEKSRQVRLMGEIYGNAVETVAWLGPEADDSNLAMSFLRQWLAASDISDEMEGRAMLDFLLSSREEFFRAQSAFKRSPGYRDLLRRSLETIDNPFGVAEWRALRALTERPYWRRVWIIQELGLAPKVTFYCGESDCEVASIGKMIELQASAYVLRMWSLYGLDSPEPIEDEFYAVRRVLNTRQTLGARASSHENSLTGLLAQTADSKATDPRDKVYGLLSLLPPERRTVVVDYTKTPSEVYADFVVSEIAASDSLTSLHILQDLAGCRTIKDLPSWVPDLSSWSCRKSFLADGGLCAAASSKASAAKTGLTLSVRGVRHSVIKEVDWGVSPLATMDSTQETTVKALRRWFDMAVKLPGADTPAGFNPAQTFLRTIYLDSSNTGPPHYLSRGLRKEAVLAYQARSYLAWQAQQRPGGGLPIP